MRWKVISWRHDRKRRRKMNILPDGYGESYREFRNNCGGCMYGTGEGGGCGMTGERYRELYANETLDNLPCHGRGIGTGIRESVYGTGEEGTAGTEVVAHGFAGYRQYKEEMDRELTRAAESFVRIGYLLRVAEDTDILRESGYRNVTEFAAAEYGLDKTQVSRFININIRFSEDGYSDRLQKKYEKFGYAKLAVMLSLPEAVSEELPGSLSKADVQAVAEEVRAEAAVSDIEAAIEKAEAAPVPPEGEESLLYRAAAQLCREQQELFQRLWYGRDGLEVMQEILVPLGEAVFMVRIPGTGRLMVTVRDQETSITVVRTGEKERYGTEEFVTELWKICNMGTTPEDAFRKRFGEEMGRTAAVPSGPAAAGERKETKQRRISRVTKARIPEPPADVEGSPAAGMEGTPAAAVPEGQLPGQMDVYDYPELVPGETGTGENETGNDSTGGTGQDGLTGHPEVHRIPAQDGCAGDSGITGGEEELWMEARKEEEKLRQYLAVWDGKERDMDDGLLRSVYHTSIRLAAALEKVMIRRGRAHE